MNRPGLDPRPFRVWKSGVHAVPRRNVLFGLLPRVRKLPKGTSAGILASRGSQ